MGYRLKHIRHMMACMCEAERCLHPGSCVTASRHVRCCKTAKDPGQQYTYPFGLPVPLRLVGLEGISTITSPPESLVQNEFEGRMGRAASRCINIMAARGRRSLQKRVSCTRALITPPQSTAGESLHPTQPSSHQNVTIITTLQ